MSSMFKVAHPLTRTRLPVRYYMEGDDVTAIGRPAVFGTATAFIVRDASSFPSRNQLCSHRTCRHCLGLPQQRHRGRSRRVEDGSKHRLDLPAATPLVLISSGFFGFDFARRTLPVLCFLPFGTAFTLPNLVRSQPDPFFLFR
jgi:hypothetical protein